MVASREGVNPGGEEFLGEARGDAIAASGVLAVSDDEVERVAAAEFRQQTRDREPSGCADDVADEK